MKNVLLITDVDFWNGGAGHRTRISSLIAYIAPKIHLTVIFTGISEIPGKINISKRFGIEFICFDLAEFVTAEQCGEQIKDITTQRHFDFCIIEYIHNSYLMNYLGEDMKFILDAHDIISDRTKSFHEYDQMNQSFEMPEEMENELFGIYDYVMVICRPDLTRLSNIVPAEKLLLCPHAASFHHHKIKTHVKNIGFVGSEYLPNLDAIHFFIRTCWPLISKNAGIKLVIYGNIVNKIQLTANDDSILLKGYIEDPGEIYNDIDIVINPVRFGAGLKIKNIEALANGLPLVTSVHGSRGMETGINEAFLVADNAGEIIGAIEKLISNTSFREALSRKAYQFANENFSPAICFDPLLKAICNQE